MRTVVGPLVIRQDGAAVESETTAGAVGPHVFCLSTAVPDLGVVVATTYVGADDVGTIATDLTLAPRPRASNRSRTIPRDSVPVSHAREQCLLDHARQVLNALHAHAHAGRRYTVNVSDDAIARVAAT